MTRYSHMNAENEIKLNVKYNQEEYYEETIK